LEHAPLPASVHNWPGLLEQFDAREILHVTFGSVLTEKSTSDAGHPGAYRFYDRFMDLLRSNPEAYAGNLEKHFIRHLEPFAERN
jgi:tagaturonate epimerase